MPAVRLRHPLPRSQSRHREVVLLHSGHLAEAVNEFRPLVPRPAGFANGFMSLTEGAKIVFFSTSTLQESLGDDIRFPARTWDPWTIEER